MDESRGLVERILAGDRAAFEQFVRTYQRLVSHVVFRLIDNAQDREDLCQDVFMKIYQGLADFRFESKMSTWVAKVAYFHCLTYLQKMRPVPLSDLAGDEHVPEEFPDDAMQPDDWVAGRDLAHRLQEEIQSLPAHYRAILTLYHLDDMSYQEIGTALDLPDGTVKSYLFRARKMLKDRLVARYTREELSCWSM